MPTGSAGVAKPRGRGGKDSSTGHGLTRLSAAVLKAVKEHGSIPYTDLVSEVVGMMVPADKEPTDKEKEQISRRLYDALNVMQSLKIVEKGDDKIITYTGLPMGTPAAVKAAEAERDAVAERLTSKREHLHVLRESLARLTALSDRNKAAGGHAGQERVTLPFIVLQTAPDASVQVEIAGDHSRYTFDFGSSLFQLYDEQHVLKQMPLDEAGAAAQPTTREGYSQPSTSHKAEAGPSARQ